MAKKVIAIVGSTDKLRGIVGAYVTSRLVREDNWRAINLDVARTFKDLVYKMVGLMHSSAYYEAKDGTFNDKPQQEFFGHTPRDVVQDALSVFEERIGPSFLGRLASRRIRFETVSNVFVLTSVSIEQLRAIATEVGPDNVCILQCGGEVIVEQHDRHFFKQSMTPIITVDGGPDLLRLLIRGVIKNWLGLTDD